MTFTSPEGAMGAQRVQNMHQTELKKNHPSFNYSEKCWIGFILSCHIKKAALPSVAVVIHREAQGIALQSLLDGVLSGEKVDPLCREVQHLNKTMTPQKLLKKPTFGRKITSEDKLYD